MHDDSSQSSNQISGRYLTHPLLRAPLAGRWVLWHGPLALALLELAKKDGQLLQKRPEVTLPEGFPKPISEGAWWRVEAEWQVYLVRTDEHKGYISCYVGNVTGQGI